MVIVTPPLLDEWLVSYIRSELAIRSRDAVVDVVEPPTLDAPLATPMVIIREDSGTQTSQLTFTRQVGISVLAGSRQNDKAARRLSQLVYAIATSMDIALADGPIASVQLEGCSGPYSVADDQDVGRRYMVVSYSVVGTW